MPPRGSFGRLLALSRHRSSLVALILAVLTPSAAAAQQPTSLVFAASQFTGTVSIIDASTNTIVDTVTLGSDPQAVAADPQGRHLYIVTGSGDLVRRRISDPNTVDASVAVGTIGEATIAIAADGKKAWIAGNKYRRGGQSRDDDGRRDDPAAERAICGPVP